MDEYWHIGPDLMALAALTATERLGHPPTEASFIFYMISTSPEGLMIEGSEGKMSLLSAETKAKLNDFYESLKREAEGWANRN